MPDLTEYIETSQAAEKLHYHVEHVRRMMREGSLRGSKLAALAGAKEIPGRVCRQNGSNEQARSTSNTVKRPEKGAIFLLLDEK
jgi:hypothetical protein